MTKRFQKLLFLVFAQAFLSQSAAGDIEGNTPTFYMSGMGGFSTYKSGMIKSNTSSTAVGYGFGVYAGRERTVGFSLQRETSTHSFQTAEIPSGTLTVSWQDIVVKYRMGPFYLGGVVGSSSWVADRLSDPEDVSTEVDEYLNISTTGFGVNTGIQIPVGKNSMIYTDIKALSTSTLDMIVLEDATLNSNDRAMALGNRLDVDVGGHFNITKSLFDGVVGFKHRTVTVEADGETYQEIQDMTYLGFAMAWQF